MRHHLITLMLTTGTFVSTDALRLRTPTGDKGSTLQLRHESDLTSRLEVGNRRPLVSRSLPQVEYVKRKDDDEKKDKLEHGHDDDGDGDDGDDPTGNAQPSTVTVTIRPTSFPSAAASPSPTPPGVNRGNDHDDHKKDKDDDSDDGLAVEVAPGVVGGVAVVLAALAAWYWFKIRPKRRARARGQHAAGSKESDIESHVTVDLRKGPHDGGSSSDVSTNIAMVAVPEPAQTESYAASKRTLATSSPATSYTSLDAYAGPHPAYGQDPPKSYSPLDHSQGSMPSGFPSKETRSKAASLQIDTVPTYPGSPLAAMELDERLPPPRYPGVVAAPHVPGPSPTSSIPVSPLSATSPRSGPHTHAEPSYDSSEGTVPPRVMSPMFQLGQTSASPAEYDESAEAVQSGLNNRNFANRQQGDEKQAFSS